MQTRSQRIVGVLQEAGNAKSITKLGRVFALAGVVLPLLMIGTLKFTQIEINALKPLIAGTPWLAWLYVVFDEAGASYLLGTVEIMTAALFLASPWSARAGVIAGVLGSMTFAVTCSTMLALPIWEDASGGFPWLNALGSFLIKDVVLLGVSLVVLGEGLARLVAAGSIDLRGLRATLAGGQVSAGPAPFNQLSDYRQGDRT